MGKQPAKSAVHRAAIAAAKRVTMMRNSIPAVSKPPPRIKKEEVAPKTCSKSFTEAAKECKGKYMIIVNNTPKVKVIKMPTKKMTQKNRC